MFYKSLTFKAALERPHVHSWVNLGRCHVLLKLIWEIPAFGAYLNFCVRACACLSLCALRSCTVHRVRGVGAPGTGVIGVLCATQIGSFLQVREAFNHCLCTESACGYQRCNPVHSVLWSVDILSNTELANSSPASPLTPRVLCVCLQSTVITRERRTQSALTWVLYFFHMYGQCFICWPSSQPC